MAKKKIEIGNKFGKLLVLEEVETRGKHGGIRYKCQCDCGNTHEAFATHLRRLKITHCGCDPCRGSKHHQWTGVGKISSGFWYDKVIRSASGEKGNRRIKEVSVTIEQAWELFLKQNEKCALSGIELYFPISYKADYTASLDRIDSSKDYILDNLQWVHKHINIMKNKFDNQYFINMCKLIAKNYETNGN